MSDYKIDALLALHGGGRFLVGRDRIKLLEKVAEFGSIAKAAKSTGFSYKTAWDSVNAVNNLLPTPAFITRPGGRSGGGAEVTPEGLRLIATFHKLEEKLARITNLIAEEGLEGQEEALLWTVGARVSARNVFQSEVAAVRRWPVDVEVTLTFGLDRQIHAIVTNESAGRPATRAGAARPGPGEILLHPVDRARPRRGGPQPLCRRGEGAHRRRAQQRGPSRHWRRQDPDRGHAARNRRGPAAGGRWAGCGAIRRQPRDSSR